MEAHQVYARGYWAYLQGKQEITPVMPSIPDGIQRAIRNKLDEISFHTPIQ